MEATAGAGQKRDSEQPKRHLRNFLLDKRFQLRWVLRVVFAVSVIVMVMGYFLYKTVAEATDQMTTAVMGQALTDEAAKAFQEQAERDKAKTLLVLVGALCSIVVLLGGATIVSTHKIAGPVYKMRKLFSSIDGRNLQLWAKLRRADELQEAFVDFDNMIRRIREHRREDIAILKEIRASVDGTGQSGEAARKIDALIEGYEKSVTME